MINLCNICFFTREFYSIVDKIKVLIELIDIFVKYFLCNTWLNKKISFEIKVEIS